MENEPARNWLNSLSKLAL